MTENEMAVAALTAALDGMKAERNWYRTAWTEAFREREELRGRLELLKQSEDTTSAALAEALVRNATLEQIKESQNRYIAKYRSEREEALEKLDAAETELEHAANTEKVLREERDELSNELAQARNRLYSLEYSTNKYKRQLDELREWSAAAREDLRLVREERDQLRNWYQSVMEQDEEFGL